MRNYAGNPSNYAANMKLVDDGDDANAAMMDQVLKPLADRTAYLKAFKDAVETTGVGRLRTVADRAALEALTGMADGEIVYVPSYGLYYYLAAASSAQASVGLPWIVKPTGAIGAWLHTSLGFADQADGLAVLDSSRKVPKNRMYRPAYEIVGVYNYVATASETVTDTPYHSLRSIIETEPLEVGDLLEATWTGEVSPNDDTLDYWPMLTVGNSIVSIVRDSDMQGPLRSSRMLTISIPRIKIVTAGVYRIMAYVPCPGATSVQFGSNVTHNVTVMRRA